ncbi:MAG: hypothetical protein GY711_01050 [bacterium]|nr:hypothetical protein [bacterium]
MTCLPYRAAVAATFLFALALPTHADRIVTEDGRVIVVKKAREKGEGYTFEFEHGTIEVADKRGIKAVEIEVDMSEYVPKNDDEREKMEKGYIRHKGKWLSKAAYKNVLAKDAAASKKRANEMASYSNWTMAPTHETKHFFLKTDTSPELADYYEKLLEAYYKLMDDRIGIKPTPSLKRTKMKVNVFKSRTEFSETKGTAPGVAGFFHSGDQELNFYHDYAEPATSDWVALHECTHLLTYLIDPQFRPQIWINEAVADYFGSATIEVDKRGKIQITPGKEQTDRVLTVQQALRDTKAIKLEDLFEIKREDFQAFEYAHAWSFVYFLNNFDEGKYQKGFNRFFRDLYTRKGVESISVPSYGQAGTGFQVEPQVIRSFLLKKIGVKDTALLEEQWHDYIRAIEIDAPEARLKRGLRSVAMFDMSDALPDLNVAIDSGLADARAYAARARALSTLGMIKKKDKTPQTAGSKVLSRAERMKLAAEDIAKAIELEPLSARFRYDQAMLMVGASPVMPASMVKEGHADEAAKAASGLATELDPDNESYRALYERFQ